MVPTKVVTPLKLDGVLDEAAWRYADKADGFRQKDPRAGEPASEETEVRVLFDAQNLYFGVKCFDKEPSGIRASELRRDNRFENDDVFAIILDTFHDHRNSYLFRINPRGTQFDAIVTEEGRNVNRDWDEKWEVETHLTDDGWVAEVKIPAKILRAAYTKEGEAQSWGIDFERIIRRKNEFAYWNSYSRDFRFEQVSQAGHIEGIQMMGREAAFRLKPYFNTRIVEKGRANRVTNSLSDVGIEDFKYRVSPGVTLDMTVNTDFAETEVDEQIINFDRVPVFFPEKREFFLEGSGVFEFGSLRGEGSDEVKLFHSRRIGLSETGQTIPMLAGAKLTGKLGRRNTVGIVEAQTDDFGSRPGQNFGVFRYKRDLLGRSSLGGFLTTVQSSGGQYNRVLGIDPNFVFHRFLRVSGLLAKSFRNGVEGEAWLRYVGVHWSDDFLTLGMDVAELEDNFDSDLGFIQRRGIRKYAPSFSLSPRPKISWMRKYTGQVRYELFTNNDNELVTELWHLNQTISLQNGGFIRFAPHIRKEHLFERLTIVPGVQARPGTYHWYYLPLTYSLNPSRKLSGEFVYRYEPGYYGGLRHLVEINPVFKPNSNLSVDVNWSINRIRVPGNPSKVVQVMNNRFNYAFSRKWLTSTLFQWANANNLVGFNFRLNYIYRPGDDIFLVYNEFHRTFASGPDQLDRAIAIKFTHSFDF